MNAGDVIRVKAYKADGTCYQSWQAMVEARDENRLVVFTPKSTPVVDIWKGNMSSDYDDRATYRFDLPLGALHHRVQQRLELAQHHCRRAPHLVLADAVIRRHDRRAALTDQRARLLLANRQIE